VNPDLPGGISCRELIELITDYLEQMMPAEERARFDEHLAACEGCRTYLSQVQQIVERTGALREESIPPDAQAALLAAFRGWKKGAGGGQA
jgi:predicted anti-sigma-YlaC factor YlaD